MKDLKQSKSRIAHKNGQVRVPKKNNNILSLEEVIGPAVEKYP